MKLVSGSVVIHHAVPAALTATARSREPKETGGLLVGWWDRDKIVIRHILEVPDNDATASSWTRNEARASEALAHFLIRAEHPWLGYIGDWHTHPAPVGPSHTDKRSIRRAARSVGHPLALIVHRSDATLDVLAVRHGIVGRSPWTTYMHDYQEEVP